MEENPKSVIESFEQIFKEQSYRKPSALYTEPLNTNNQEYKPKDVINIVYRQMKAIQLADCNKTVKNSEDLNIVKRSSFLTVNKLPLYHEASTHNPNKFETQCFSNTQLINIIKDAEAIDTHSGITQEFDTTFTHAHNEESSSDIVSHRGVGGDKDSNVKSSIVAIPKVERDRSSSDKPLEGNQATNTSTLEMDTADDIVNDIVPKNIDNDSTTTVKSAKDKVTVIDEISASNSNVIMTESILDMSIDEQNDSFILPNKEPERYSQIYPNQSEKVSNNNMLIGTELTSDSQDVAADLVDKTDQQSAKENNKKDDIITKCTEIDEVETERPQSPVLNVRNKNRKIRIPTPLVVSLESFEKFESIAIQLIEKNDVETAKHLINSQILGNELCFINTDVIFNMKRQESSLLKREESPILEIQNDKLQIKSQDILHSQADEYDNIIPISHIKSIMERRSESLKDEILFSSDEEDFIHKENEDLPLTCALETSFYNTSDVLEKTMYVGFQTASNKSIQILTDSFENAKSLLDNDDNAVKDFSLSKLVEKIDTSHSKPGKSVDSDNISSLNEQAHVNSETKAVVFKKNAAINSELKQDQEMCEQFQAKVLPINSYDATIKKPPEKQTLTEKQTFMTANNKKMNLSDKALKTCMNIFKDSDTEKEIYVIDDQVKTVLEFKQTKDGLPDNYEKIQDDSAKIDFDTKNTAVEKEDLDINLIDDNINDELILQEFENIEMSLEENEVSLSNEDNKDFVFEGFKTASNKHIKISDDAIEQMKNVFHDIDLEINNQQNITDVKMKSLKDKPTKPLKDSSAHSEKNIGFKTASNKNVGISIQALAKAKNIFQDVDMEIDYPHENILVNDESNVNAQTIDQSPRSIATFVGFKTANNKHIIISDDALSKSKDIFKNLDKRISKQNAQNNTVLKENTDKRKYAVFEGIEPASNKNVKSCNQAPTKSMKMLQDMDINNSFNIVEENCNIEVKNNPHLGLQGLETANNTSMQDTDEGLAKNKKLFEEVPCDEDKVESPVLKGFQTANKKPVTVCEEALTTSKKILHDIDTPNEKLNKPCYQLKKAKSPIFKGFQTASEKPVTVSEAALATSKKIFQDIDSSNVELNEPYEQISKVIEVSELALVKSKRLFQDIDISNIKQNKPCDQLNAIEHPMFESFRTASKKPVTVSEEALAKSKNIFQEIDTSNFGENKRCDQLNKIENPVFKGFQTASKKPVTVSAEALTKSKKVFQDLDENFSPKYTSSSLQVPSKNILKEFNENKSETNAFVAFKTASNKNVEISEIALAECKQVFDDIDSQPIYTEFEKDQPMDGNFKGFKTANNATVGLSKDVLGNAKKIFKDNIDSFTHEEQETNNVNSKDKRITFAGFQTASNKNVDVSEKALAKSRQLFQDCKGFENDHHNDINLSKEALKTPNKLLFKINDKNSCSKVESKPEDIGTLIDTQVLNNFEENLCTEDFRDTPRPNKRSASPILSCPRAKSRKKFETPYKNDANNDNTDKCDTKHDTDINKVVQDVKKIYNDNDSAITFKEDYKKNKKYTLKDLTKLENDKIKIDPYLLNFNLENILNLEFDEERNDLTRAKMSIDEIKRIFIDATDRKLIPEGWLENHLKLILWKLISYELKFSNVLGKVCTVRNVIDQLKYRYDKELYNAERPALRKILEKDDAATKTMVLCVAGIYVDGVSVTSPTTLTNIELLLTDGWYFLKANIDKMLSKLVYDQKIVVGTKIVTSGAELVNCEQGVAPWEDTSSIYLKIFGNSTRRARWDTKLGYHNAAILNHLSTVKVDGGKIDRLKVYVTRVYPMLYVEKFQDGSTVTRSERLEHLHQIKYEAEREAMLEKIYEEVEKEFSDQESQDSEDSLNASNKRKCYESGSQIAKIMKMSKDPVEFRATLTSTQVNLLQEHTSRQYDKYLQAIQNKVQDKLCQRNVVTLARGRVVSLRRDGDKFTVTKAMLSVWKPNDAVMEIFKEGSWIEVMNVAPTAVRYSELQISAGRQSVFRPAKCKNDETFQPHLLPLKRICYSIHDLSQNLSTDCNDIDTVGIIFLIEPSNREFEPKHQFQNVYLSDIDKNMICVNFWGGVKKFGFEYILDTAQVIYCANLQRRAGNTRKNIPQYRVTEFSYFTKTPKNVGAREMAEEINKKMFGLDRRKFCEDCVTVKQNYSVIKCMDAENISPYRFDKSDYNLGKNKMFIDTPKGISNKGNINNPNSEDFNLSGLDFESTFRQTDTQELSPKTLLRKKEVSKRIAKLKMYGEPPPLSPINIINKSKNATKEYKSPLISKNDRIATPNKFTNVATSNLLNELNKLPKQSIVTTLSNLHNVATPKKIPQESSKTVDSSELGKSPIISMNRTYVKRSVNPVKLNFTESVAIDENIDHFAEEFDGSPPLSLE